MTAEITINEREALTWPEKARAITITSQTTYDMAANLRKDLRTLRQGIIADNKTPIEKATESLAAARDHRDKYLKPVEEAEEILKGSLKKFEEEQERLRRIEQARLAAEQMAREAEERKERMRLAEIARQQALQAGEAALAAARQQEQERILAEAVQAEAMGIAVGVEEPLPVEAFLEPAPYTPPVIAAPTFEKAKGLHLTRPWSAEVTDIRLLARAVADGTVSPDTIMGNQVVLNGLARSLKQTMNLPGVRSVQR